MAYIKIVLALLVWGVLFFYGASLWLDDKREQTCTAEIEKDKPDLNVVKERCLQTAEVYMENEEYGFATWFYLLGGDLDTNLNKVEAKITDNFYMNIGHTYLLMGDFEKAKKIYSKYPWEAGEDFHYANERMQSDFIILPKLYKDKKDNLEKGLAIWNEVYEPIGKIVEASNAYSMALDEGNSTKQMQYLKEYLEYAIPFKNEPSIEYIAKKEALADFYSYNSNESIEIYKEIAAIYETNTTKEFEYIRTLVIIAERYENISEHNLSLHYYEKVLTLTQESNETKLPLSVDIIYSNMANIYNDMNKENEALDYYAKSVKYLLEHDSENYGGLSEEYSNIAIIYYAQKEYNLSIENYNNSIELKKEELKDSEEYYRDYTFSSLEALYLNLAKNYKALNMQEKEKETNRAYIAFMEYEYETHYKHIAMAYDTFANRDINSSTALESYLMAIQYMKQAVETEWGSQKEANNETLFMYMSDLKEYIYTLDKNKIGAAKAYIEHLELFIEFEEEVSEEENNNAVLSKTYKLLADTYKSIDDEKSFLKYQEKSLELSEESNETKGEVVYAPL